jgi:hypothetical protein
MGEFWQQGLEGGSRCRKERTELLEWKPSSSLSARDRHRNDHKAAKQDQSLAVENHLWEESGKYTVTFLP